MTQQFGSISVVERVLPGRQAPTAVIQLADPTSKAPVLWSGQKLEELVAAIDHIAESAAEAVAITGSAHSFGSGADLSVIGGLTTVAEATEAGYGGFRAFRRLHELEIPSFAIITGFALGGGLEIGLFADHRVASSDVKGIGLPEVGLGILPGWGGAYWAARLGGPVNAIRTAVEDPLKGRLLTADAAAERGLVDDVLPADGFDEAWPQWVAERIDAGRREVGWPDAGETAAAVGVTERALASGRPRSSESAERALELIAAAPGQGLDDAERMAAEGFGVLAPTDATRAALYAQGLMRRKPVVPEGLAGGIPRPIRKAAVIGAGLMASQLATLIARYARVPVTLTDLDEERAQAGAERVRAQLAKLAQRGRLDPQLAEQIAAGIEGTTDQSRIADADFVIEAVFEDYTAKEQVFAGVEQHVSAEAILATNTSSLSVSRIAATLQHPERFIGFHVFNPVEAVPLLEIIPGGSTGADALATALALGGATRRAPVICQDAPGFIVNRLLTRLFDVVSEAIDSGADPIMVDHALDPMGLPMTPLQLLDFVGPAVQGHVGETMRSAFPERFGPTHWLDRVVAAGQRRVLDDAGQIAPDAAALLPERAESQPSPESLLDRALENLADEARRMIDDGVVAEAEDIDQALILGANYPRFAGGLTPLLDRTGASERATGRRFHAPGVNDMGAA